MTFDVTRLVSVAAPLVFHHRYMQVDVPGTSFNGKVRSYFDVRPMGQAQWPIARPNGLDPLVKAHWARPVGAGPLGQAIGPGLLG